MVFWLHIMKTLLQSRSIFHVLDFSYHFLPHSAISVTQIISHRELDTGYWIWHLFPASHDSAPLYSSQHTDILHIVTGTFELSSTSLHTLHPSSSRPLAHYSIVLDDPKSGLEFLILSLFRRRYVYARKFEIMYVLRVCLLICADVFIVMS